MTDNFPAWIDRQFVLWQAKEGERKTIQDFAAYLGISRPLLNMWMNGNRRPGTENIKILEEVFGQEVYDALGLPRPNPYLQVAVQKWEFISEEAQERIAREIAEEAAKYEAKKKSDTIRPIPKRRKT